MKKCILIFFLSIITVTAQSNKAVKNITKNKIKNNLSSSSETTRLESSVPRKISYQGLITKSDGTPTPDGSYEVLFKVYNVSEGGDAVWFENQQITVTNGIMSAVLGSINPFTNIPDESYLELTVDGSTLSPRQILTSVFYSILSDTSNYAKSANYIDLENLPNLDIYVLKDSLQSYTTSEELYDTLSNYQMSDTKLTEFIENNTLNANSLISTNGNISIIPDEGSSIILDSLIQLSGASIGNIEDPDLVTLTNRTLIVDGTLDVATITGDAVLDEDDLASDSPFKLATQQSIKAYIDTKQDADSSLQTISSLEQNDGSFIVSDGVNWTAENDSVARSSLGLGELATQDANSINITGGSINGASIGAISPSTAKLTSLEIPSNSSIQEAIIGTISIDENQITDSNGTISFGDNNFETEGRVTTGPATIDGGSTIGDLSFNNGTITSSGGNISFGDENLETSGALEVGLFTSNGIANLGSGTKVGEMTISNGSITDNSGTISFGNENIETDGSLSAGVSAFDSGTEIGNITFSNGSIASSSDTVNFGNDAIITSGNISSGLANIASGSSIGNLTIGDGYINSEDGVISFGDENLLTSGSFTADSLFGDGSNLTGVQATSTGVLAGDSPIMMEGVTSDDFELTISLEDPTNDRIISFPDVSGTIITSENDQIIDKVGTINTGTWEGSIIEDNYISDDLTLNLADINGGTIDGVSITGSDVTISTGNILDISNGTISLADDQISGDKINNGTIGSVTISQLGGALDVNNESITNINVQSGIIDAVTLGTNSAISQAVIDNINIDGSSIGHVDDIDLISLGNENVTINANMTSTSSDLSIGDNLNSLQMQLLSV